MGVWNTVNIAYVLDKNRIDADFYKKEDVELELFLKKVCQNAKLKTVAFEIQEKFNKNNYKCFQYNDIGNTDLEFGTVNDNIINSKQAPGRATYVNKADDVLISTVRPNRNANAIINSRDILQVGSNGFCNIRSKEIDSNYIFIYSKTNYFIKTLIRATTSSMYPAVSNKDVMDVPFFVPNNNDLKLISEKVIKARELLKVSQKLYKQAIRLINDKLDIDKIIFNTCNYFITHHTSCVQERIIDPKFHNPKFNQIIKHLNDNFETIELGKIVNIEYGYMPMQDYELESSKGIPFIRVTNITQELEIKMDDLKYIPNWVKVPLKKFVEQGDILIVQCGDTTGKVGYIYEDIKNHLFPSFCFSLKVKNYNKINSLFLAALLKSKLMQILFDQTVMTNTVRPNTTKPSFEKLVIPIFEMDFQLEIANLLLNSNKAKRQSQELLSYAKIRVEQLIDEALNNK